jgi:CBS domain containing-hemolysin-like protein
MLLGMQVKIQVNASVVVVVVELVVVVVEVVPQTFGVPLPPQISGSVQVPQKRMSGQVPSSTRPQLAAAASHVVGVQHTPAGRLPGGALFTQTPPQHP